MRDIKSKFNHRFLNKCFGDLIIGCGLWTPRCQNLTKLDFSFFSITPQKKVNSDKSQILQQKGQY